MEQLPAWPFNRIKQLNPARRKKKTCIYVVSTEYHSRRNHFFIGHASKISRDRMMHTERRFNRSGDTSRAVYVCNVWEVTSGGKVLKMITSSLSDCSVHHSGAVVQVKYEDLCQHISRVVNMNEQLYAFGKAIKPAKYFSNPIPPLDFGEPNQ
jgi:hypothetical protein